MKEKNDIEPLEKTHKSCLAKGCLIMCFLTFIAIVGLTIVSIYLSNKSTDNYQKNKNKTELFIKIDTPDYKISNAKEAEFFSMLSKIFSKDDYEEAKEKMLRIKEIYPEGYFVIVHRIFDNQDLFIDIYNNFKNNDEDMSDFLSHELTHSTLFEDAFLIEDKKISIKDGLSLYEMLPSGEVLLQYINEPTDFDFLYLSESKQNLLVSVDEVNAYTKSVRNSRNFKGKSGFGGSVSASSNLARQLYFVTLHIKYIKKNQPSTYLAIQNNRGFAYIIMRLIKMAETELLMADSEGLFNQKTGDNLALFNENRYILEQYFDDAGVNDFSDTEFDYQELRSKGIDFTIEKVK
ncbi:hypothetical protein [Candidatus Oleimmundimicrobium sp.]|uniref:hypothetical protein n=1 Tax=Candidatus Oleimmundimicrobium sp. TaxID=3060597 RepID=UPI00271B3C49|nr:hypothetical protein [Candidatus Oleimmundimicrobium sp.]MDO8886464.1 hypothetical protein [Candidatus Oleimmundimicrobium sp.]